MTGARITESITAGVTGSQSVACITGPTSVLRPKLTTLVVYDIDSSQFFNHTVTATIVGMMMIPRSVPLRQTRWFPRRRLCRLLLTGCLSLSAMPALSQSQLPPSREEIKSARCAAIFTMLAQSFADDAQRAPVFRRFIGVFNDLYLQELRERTGSARPEDSEQRRAELLQEFRTTYTSREAAMKEEVVLCGAWADGYLAQADNVTYVPVIPKLIPPAVRAEYEALAITGWGRWLK